MENKQIIIDMTPSKKSIDKYSTADVSVVVKVSTLAIAPRDLIENVAMVVIVDTSGSMNGCGIAEAKSSVGYILDNISSSCYISVIAFEGSVHEITAGLVEATRENIDCVRRSVDNIIAIGSTNLAGALIAGCKQAIAFADKQRLPVNILVITDGCHNVGESIQNARVMIRDSGIPLHAYSIGSDPDAKALLSLVSESPGGRYEHIEKASYISLTFKSFVCELKSRYVNNCIVTFNACIGVRVKSIDGPYRANAQNNKTVTYNLGHLPSGVTKAFLLRLSVRKLSNEEVAALQRYAGVQEIIGVSVVAGISCTERKLSLGRYCDSMNDCMDVLEERLRIKTKDAIIAATDCADRCDTKAARELIKKQIMLLSLYQDGVKSAQDDILQLSCLLNKYRKGAYASSRNGIYDIICVYNNQSGCYTTPVCRYT